MILIIIVVYTMTLNKDKFYDSFSFCSFIRQITNDFQKYITKDTVLKTNKQL